MKGISVKICGLSQPEHVAVAVEAGARYLGFVFFPKSPRNVSIETATALALEVPPGVAKVALVVNAGNDLLDDIAARVPLDMWQLHGQETPARVAEVRARYGLPVMKAVGISSADDLAGLAAQAEVADQILVDAKPPRDAEVPGGQGVAFDWRLIAGRNWAKPWMLAGGLTAQNVKLAIGLTGARQVDVSSGVEVAPGQKDSDLIRAFIAAAQAR